MVVPDLTLNGALFFIGNSTQNHLKLGIEISNIL